MFVAIVLAFATLPVHAEESVTASTGPTGAKNTIRKDIREMVKENRQEIREEVKELKGTPRPTIAAMRKSLNLIARLSDVTLVSKTGSMTSGALTVKTKEGTTLTVNLGANSHVMRRFWGKVGSFDEMQVGDVLNITGKYTDDTKTAVNAILVRDRSIQKRFGVFIGTVSNVSATGFTLTTPNRGAQTVTLTSSMKLTDRTGKTITATDMQNGHRVRVHGLWNVQAKTLTEVKQLKDFSLPVRPTAVSAQ